jgi:hypothetical protein
MRLNRSIWRAFLAVLLVVLPLTALVVVPAAGAADPVLYTQVNNPNALSYAISTDYAAPFDSSDSRTADDFVVPNDAKWQISQVDVGGSSLLASQPTSFNVFIYTNVANDPGVQIFSATGLAYTQVVTSYSIPVPNGPTLTEGTYWLVVQANAAVGQNWGWMNRNATSGTQAQFVNPGGSVSAGCTSGWNNRTTCLSQGNPDQIFVLYGLTLPNLPPVNTVPGAQAPIVDNQTLTFSAANSNAISVDDPDAGTENLEVSLSVLHGTLTLATTAGLGFGCGTCSGDGTADASMTFRGNLTQINNALNGLVYDPTNGYGGPDTLTITTNDRGNNGTGGALSDTDTVALAVQARTIVDMISGSMQYGGANANLTARLRTVDGDIPVPGQVLVFTSNGVALCGQVDQQACPTTNASGIATLIGTVGNPGLNVGFRPNALTVEFAGSQYYLPSSGTGNLQIARRILWIKPVDRTVGLRQPNPPTNPNVDPNCPAPSRCLELANGSTFAPGEGFANVNLANLRFQYNRNPPYTNATETVGKIYRITAFGAASANYDIRYAPGNLTVVAP